MTTTDAKPPDQPPSKEIVALTPPAAVAPVAADQATQLVAVDPAAAGGLDQKAEQFVNELGGLDTHSTEFQTKLKAIYDLGSQDIRDSAAVSNRLLDKPT